MPVFGMRLHQFISKVQCFKVDWDFVGTLVFIKQRIYGTA